MLSGELAGGSDLLPDGPVQLSGSPSAPDAHSDSLAGFILFRGRFLYRLDRSDRSLVLRQRELLRGWGRVLSGGLSRNPDRLLERPFFLSTGRGDPDSDSESFASGMSGERQLFLRERPGSFREVGRAL